MKERLSNIWLHFGIVAITTLAALKYVLLDLGPEKSQGFAQKIFFFHVPSAFMMYLFVSLATVFSIVYLVNKKSQFDLWARVSMYTATLFGTIVLTSGPIWAKPIWGVYWTWDPRLTTSFVVFILLVGYCFVRKIFDEQAASARKGAVIGAIISILALADIPLIHFSVKLWRGVHPSVLKESGGLPQNYSNALQLMILAFLFLSFLIWRLILRTERLKIEVGELQYKALVKRGGQK